MQLKNLINESINEELCISDKVVRTANEICNAVCGEKSFNKELVCEKPRVHYSLNSFNIDGISISCGYYFFNTPEDAETYFSKHKKEDTDAKSVMFKGMKMMFINALSVSGRVLKERLISSVMHEVEHLFQQENREKPFHEDNGNKLYMATESIMNTCSDVRARRVAIGMYLSFDYEADAYLNELYSDIVNVTPDIFNMDKVLKDSLLYKYMEISSEVLENIESGKESCSEAISEYSKYGVDIDLSTIRKRLARSIERIAKKTGKVVVKAKKDLIDAMRGFGNNNFYEIN